MRYTEVTPTTPLTKSLENLGALNKTGLFEVKPFKDWKGTPEWKEKIFTFRLCNSGEVLDIVESIKNTNDSIKTETNKVEFLSRAIYAIEGSPLISSEELTKYNELHKTEFSSIREWTAIYIRNLENIVKDRLYAIYESLELKQMRQLQGIYLCGITNKIFSKDLIPEGSIYLKYSLAEIITPEGMILEPNYKDIFDIEEPISKVEENKVLEPSITTENQVSGESFEEVKNRMENEG